MRFKVFLWSQDTEEGVLSVASSQSHFPCNPKIRQDRGYWDACPAKGTGQRVQTPFANQSDPTASVSEGFG